MSLEKGNPQPHTAKRARKLAWFVVLDIAFFRLGNNLWIRLNKTLATNLSSVALDA